MTPSQNDMKYVLGSADYLIMLLEKHGNIPMCGTQVFTVSYEKIGSNRHLCEDGDRDEAHPVQWCHGAPGGMASQLESAYRVLIGVTFLSGGVILQIA